MQIPSPFVDPQSIVRRIWGNSDTILFIFAGAAAEFALNKAVDWLYFTGRLPADPIGRLFSTVTYAQRIVFSSTQEAHQAIDTIRAIHQGVEQDRGATIPAWAYRDVLFMLIHYSIAAQELLHAKLNDAQKDDVYDVFLRLGQRMMLEDLPPTYRAWLPVREMHLRNDLEVSTHTVDLFAQYKKHLGAFRFHVLVESQKLVVPPVVLKKLNFNPWSWLLPAVALYKVSRLFGLHHLIKNLLLPRRYRNQINALNRPAVRP